MSRPRKGRLSADRNVIELIQRVWQANPTWVSPRIGDELAKLGQQVTPPNAIAPKRLLLTGSACIHSMPGRR